MQSPPGRRAYWRHRGRCDRYIYRGCYYILRMEKEAGGTSCGNCSDSPPIIAASASTWTHISLITNYDATATNDDDTASYDGTASYDDGTATHDDALTAAHDDDASIPVNYGMNLLLILVIKQLFLYI